MNLLKINVYLFWDSKVRFGTTWQWNCYFLVSTRRENDAIFITTSGCLARKREWVHFEPNPWDWVGNEICGQIFSGSRTGHTCSVRLVDSHPPTRLPRHEMVLLGCESQGWDFGIQLEIEVSEEQWLHNHMCWKLGDHWEGYMLERMKSKFVRQILKAAEVFALRDERVWRRWMSGFWDKQGDVREVISKVTRWVWSKCNVALERQKGRGAKNFFVEED